MTMQPIHFSTLKAMAASPAHFKAALSAPLKETTRAMRVGTAAHEQILGPHSGHGACVVFRGGDRRGKEWLAFAAANEGREILTGVEWDEATPMAEAVTRDPVARELLYSTPAPKTEVPLRWECQGIPFETHGIDIIGADYLAELKTTVSAHPSRWQRLAFTMLYHAQLAMYQDAARANGFTVDRVYAIGVESSPPYPVTVLQLTDAILDLGRRTYTSWVETLRGCLESDQWPGYVQSAVAWEPPAWLDGGGDE